VLLCFCCVAVFLLLFCCCVVVVLLCFCCVAVFLLCCCVVVAVLLLFCCCVVVVLLCLCCVAVLLLCWCVVAVLLLLCCCVFCVVLLCCCCCVVVVLLLCCCCVAVLLCCCCCVAVLLLLCCCVVVVLLLCCCVVAVFLLCCCVVVVLVCFCCVVVVLLCCCCADCVCVQEQFISLCKTLYKLFGEDPLEQQLYHSIATVASLLLRIGEVGKRFTAQAPPLRPQREGGPAEARGGRASADARSEPGEETKDDASPYPDDGGGRRRGSVLDVDWSITFEQVLASLLTEPPLVDYFEKKRDFQNKMAASKAQRAVERQTSSASDHELTQHST